MEARKLFVGGAWVAASADAAVRDVISPFDEEVIARVPDASASDVDAAVQAAAGALAAWSALGGRKRAQYLRAVADELVLRKAALSELETRDSGKPFAEAEWDLDDCATCLRYYAGLAEELDLDESESDDAGPRAVRSRVAVDVGDADYRTEVRQEPAGVAGCIVPFNYPLLLALWKLGPALAAGCTVVLKPSEHTPLSALAFGEVLAHVGLPAGVVNVVTGASAAGEALVAHPMVKVVSFTGSVATGVAVSVMAAPQVKSVGLELGGKSAAVVFADADLDKAAEWVCFGCFWTNGQICSATSRLVVEASVADVFVAKLKAVAAKIRVGQDPMEEGCRLGPLVSAAQRDKALALVRRGLEQGATLACGSADPDPGKGFFVAPTILVLDGSDDAGDGRGAGNVCWTEEIFAPVLTVRSFEAGETGPSTVDRAVALANDSAFGLAAAVFSKDDAKLEQFASAARVGIVWQNCSQPCFCQLPWGGRGVSGVGRDLGVEGLRKFLEPKQVVRYVSKAPLGWYDTSAL